MKSFVSIPDDVPNLESAIDIVADNGVIRICSGTYEIKSPITMSKNIYIYGDGDCINSVVLKAEQSGLFVIEAERVKIHHIEMRVGNSKKTSWKFGDELTDEVIATFRENTAIIIGEGNLQLSEC